MKSHTYEVYKNITKELLDSIKVGDLIKINDWKKPYRVKGVSKNYFVMTAKMFGNTYYSVCQKIPWKGIRHNAMIGGKFHCGTDNWVFGSPFACSMEELDPYSFEDKKLTEEYLEDFENADSGTELSARNSVPIEIIYIKRSEVKK